SLVLEDRNVSSVEGAGGKDTIRILGNSSVKGDVRGGHEGSDNSQAWDLEDDILIDTTGTIEGDVAGDQGDDTITIVNGTIEGDVYGDSPGDKEGDQQAENDK